MAPKRKARPKRKFDALSTITGGDILNLFDTLAKDKVIFYSPPTSTRTEISGFKFEFVVSGSIVNKPQAGQSLTSTSTSDQPPEPPKRFGPGSDIAFSDERLLIQKVQNTHLLVFNKFPVFKPQLLLLTEDSYRRQKEPLDASDLAATFEVLLSLDLPEYEGTRAEPGHCALYNCGPASGASRQHKHVQILPKPADLFIPDRCVIPLANIQYHSKMVPFAHSIQYLHHVDYEYKGEVLEKLYAVLLNKAKIALSLPVSATEVEHNVIMTLDWIIVIPRRDAWCEELLGPNAAGMMGLVWVDTEEKVKKWEEKGPLKVLQHCGAPIPKE